MIVDCVENWGRYPLGEAWRRAFEFLAALTPDAEEKEYPLLGRDVYARVMSYPTRAPEDAALEAHRVYMDIQTVLVGAEAVSWHPLDALKVRTPYDAAKDVEFYVPPPGHAPARVLLRPGIFAALFPQEPHMPQLMAAAGPEKIKKVVVKIALRPPC